MSCQLLPFLLLGPLTAAASQDKPVGVVCHVQVVSDKVPDVSSLQAWKQAFLKDGMTDQEKALAVWRTTLMI